MVVEARLTLFWRSGNGAGPIADSATGMYRSAEPRIGGVSVSSARPSREQRAV